MTKPIDNDFFTPEIAFTEMAEAEAKERYKPAPWGPAWLPAFRRTAVGLAAATALFLGSAQALVTEPVITLRALGAADARAAEGGEPDKIFRGRPDMDGLARLLLARATAVEYYDDVI